MDLKLQRLSQGERIAAGSALGLFVCMFFGWFNFGFAVSNAWDSLHYVSPILAIAIVATLTITILKASDRSIGDIPGGSVIFALGCIAALLVLFRMIDPISASDASPFGGSGIEEGGSAEAGLFLGFFAALGIVIGGYMATEGRVLDQVRGLFGGGGPALPQSPLPPAATAPPLESPAPESVPTAAGPALPPVEHAPLPPVEHAPLPSVEHAPLPSVEHAPLPSVERPLAGGTAAAFCEHCGAQIGTGDRFCGACGQATGLQ